MKLAFIVVGSILGVVILSAAIAALIGTRMPANHVAERSLRLRRSATDVYGLIRNFAASPTWRADVQRVEVIDSDKFREHGSNGAVTYQIVEDIPNQKIVTKIIDVNLGYSGSWEYRIEEIGNETLLTITETGIVSNPLFRFMSRYIFGHTATIDAYLKAAAAKL